MQFAKVANRLRRNTGPFNARERARVRGRALVRLRRGAAGRRRRADRRQHGGWRRDSRRSLLRQQTAP